LKNIDVPLSIKNISTVLPGSRYVKNTENVVKKIDFSSNPEEEQNQKNSFVLDRFLK